MNHMVLEHLSGSNANQVEEFPLTEYKELLVGRDASAHVRFVDSETLVGRKHLKIAQDPSDPEKILITDLNSRNGTFLNGRRIEATEVLKPGDIVQLGPTGPEFRFGLKPPTESLREMSTPTQLDPTLQQPTLQPSEPVQPPVNFALAHLAAAAPKSRAAPVREDPVVFVGEPETEKSNKLWIIGGLGLLTLVALAVAILGYRSFVSSRQSAIATAAPEPSATPNLDKPNGTAPAGAEVDAERDAQRSVWRIDVSPSQTLGWGQPGKDATHFDKPDGLAYSPKGLLFVTDAGNGRVQVWDGRTGKHLGQFGSGIFGGEIADIAVAPNDTVYVTDQTLNLAYTFVPPQPGQRDEKGKPLGPYDYQFSGTRFGEQQFKKLGGIAIDSRGRIYIVDAHLNDVHRFNADNLLDEAFNFEPKRADGDTYLHGSQGVVIDEGAGNLLIGSERDRVILVFDSETGAYKQRLVGASLGTTEKPQGKHIFFGSVEGLALARGHLLAVDKEAGHIQVFNLERPDVFNKDLAGYGEPQPDRSTGYRGFLGHSPRLNFADTTNVELQRQVRDGAVVPGKANPPGYFCSPGSIASYHDTASGDTYLAIADRCNYRVAVYRWSDIGKALGQPITVAATGSPSPTVPRPAAKVKAPAPIVTAPVRRPRNTNVDRRPGYRPDRLRWWEIRRRLERREDYQKEREKRLEEIEKSRKKAKKEKKP